jgi:hypothetical protein
MPNPALRVVSAITSSRVGSLLLKALPDRVASVLADLGEGGAESGEVRRGTLEAGQSARGASFLLGAVREGATVRAVNVVRGTVEGGSLRAVNLIVGDVLGGELEAVNVIVGTVRGGELSDVHIVLGDVHGGNFARCYAVIGDVFGGSGRVARVIGTVHSGELEVGERIES